MVLKILILLIPFINCFALDTNLDIMPIACKYEFGRYINCNFCKQFKSLTVREKFSIPMKFTFSYQREKCFSTIQNGNFNKPGNFNLIISSGNEEKEFFYGGHVLELNGYIIQAKNYKNTETFLSDYYMPCFFSISNFTIDFSEQAHNEIDELFKHYRHEKQRVDKMKEFYNKYIEIKKETEIECSEKFLLYIHDFIYSAKEIFMILDSHKAGQFSEILSKINMLENILNKYDKNLVLQIFLDIKNDFKLFENEIKKNEEITKYSYIKSRLYNILKEIEDEISFNKESLLKFKNKILDLK